MLWRAQSCVMNERRRFKQRTSLEERLDAAAKRLKDEAWKLPAGMQREDLLRKAREMKVASHLDEWLTSPGLKPPA